jgi:CheY-like chemotaxis protein
MERAKILIADDDMLLRRLMSLMLRHAGYKVLEAKHGGEVLEMVQKDRPDLILLDVMMPILDGFSTCKALRENSQTRSIPIIMVTAKGGKEDVVTAIRLGADDYVIKPYRQSTLLAKVEKRLAEGVRTFLFSKRPTVERRREERILCPMEVSFRCLKAGTGKLSPIYTTLVVDISSKGMAFEFARCLECTGYEQGTVHPYCLLSLHSFKHPKAKDLQFTLFLKEDTPLEVGGKITHIYQPADKPELEHVGVCFTQVQPEVQEVLKDFLSIIVEGAKV